MKLGRNDLCSCGSGKKYKRCCMDNVSKQHAEMSEDFEQIAAMNPHLTLDELNVVAQHRVHERNNQPNVDFCGLSPSQISNWLYAPFNELEWVNISTPEDLSSSPVMRYLALILDEAMQNEGAFKATSKGNLPTKLVTQASELMPEFVISQYQIHTSVSEYSGSNEDKFNALHYTRVLAEISGVIYRRSGCYHMKKAVQKQYQTQGLKAFFLPMLEAATTQYNWGYFDHWENDVDLRTFWLFMLWRLQSHGIVDQLIEEVVSACPDLLLQYSSEEYFPPDQLFSIQVESRFIERFLQFWGFVTLDPMLRFSEDPSFRKVDIQPLLTQTFQFTI
ncbi:SEC-C domain-containing protein [Amphritea sp. 2_MG-2023]|uniref:YecA family protein n=1 Tax=Amphritea TaxID=515417 RepID=UPI001C069341|nr:MULTISPECIES: SEC-C domain-containing protein [Amphritea]MBU2967042.1 SEC-C domain-containing protein [Amphritea atlantica]MDO6419404.1 SEC-C domain-containing protein [Amphritea sp. 2_MG-2023]